MEKFICLLLYYREIPNSKRYYDEWGIGVENYRIKIICSKEKYI